MRNFSLTTNRAIGAGLLLAVLAGSAAIAQQGSPQEGQDVKVWAKLAPADDGSGQPELGVIFSGAFARHIFNAMKVPEVKDLCTEGVEKRDGDGLVCNKFGNPVEYMCSVGYVLHTRKTTDGPLTC